MPRILIVDDDEHIAKALSIRLRANGYEVEQAFDGPDAVRRVASFRPDLVVMDVNMPAGGGVLAAERIAEQSDCPVIFVTASTQPEIRASVEGVGAAGLFEKPLDTARFLEHVRATLDRSRA
jgi:DNA-binding response OmpR family regulator